MTTIRDFDSYNDALAAITEAGGTRLSDSNETAGTSGQSFAPTVYFRLPDGGKVEVVWASGEGRVWPINND